MMARRWWVACWVPILWANPIRAQGRSPVQDWLGQAQAAMNDLRYTDADSVAQIVLGLPGIRRVDRVRALLLSASALYPEQESARNGTLASERLRQLVRIAPTAAIPREWVWAGLDSLLAESKRTTFGVSAAPRDRYVLTGPEEEADIEVATSRPTHVTMWLETESGSRFQLANSDINGRDALRFRILQGEQPRLRSGRYRLVLTAIDNSMPDTIRFSYPTTISADPIEYVAVPTALDRSTMLPERTKPRRVGGIMAGIGIMAATIMASRAMRGGDLRTAAAVDGRTIGLGVVLGLGTAGGVWALDRGVPIPANISANQASREAFAKSVVDARNANAELRRAYKAVITVTPEG